MRGDHAWLRKAACRDHESLTPDAWYELNQYGIPNDIGMKALGVCVMSCPVKDRCQVYMAEFGVRATIAGGGWFDNAGAFHRHLPQDTVDAEAVGSMLGISQAAIRHLIKEGVLLSAGKSTGGRHIFAMADILARKKLIMKKMEELAAWELKRKQEAVHRAALRASRNGIRKATAERWAKELEESSLSCAQA